MNWDAAKVFWDACEFLMLCAIGLYTYMSKRSAITEQKLLDTRREIDAHLHDHATRLARLEEGPTHEHLSDLHSKINGVDRVLNELKGAFDAANGTLKLILDHLMQQK
ncbi:MAG: hypothetical protein IT532_00245 [Burkholderiales bacterium]|nr:hypothetical protein [Burkholderiales bacterium]